MQSVSTKMERERVRVPDIIWYNMQGLRIVINQAQTDMHELQYWKVLRLHEVHKSATLIV